MYDGWYLVAFDSELAGALTSVTVGDIPLVLVRDGNRVRAFDATCPHRGANLAFGGRLDGQVIVCPFHGKRVRLGAHTSERYCVREYPVLDWDGLVFLRCSQEHENGLGGMLKRLTSDDHVFGPRFALPMQISADMVIENAFDGSHFQPVHRVRNQPALTVRPDEAGSFVAEGVLEVPVSQWQLGDGGETVSVPYTAHAYSPQLVLSSMSGDAPYWVVTGATPTAEGSCVVRQALTVPATAGHAAHDMERVRYLVRQSRAGLEQDRAIWEHLRPPPQPRYAADDATVLDFRRYCERFLRAAG